MSMLFKIPEAHQGLSVQDILIFQGKLFLVIQLHRFVEIFTLFQYVQERCNIVLNIWPILWRSTDIKCGRETQGNHCMCIAVPEKLL